MRICITGGPQTGKTTLAKKMATPKVFVIHGDDSISLGWSESSAHIAKLMDGAEGDWICEGVQVPRALRKMLDAHPKRKPCDRLIMLNDRVGDKPVLKGHEAMEKGLRTVLDKLIPKLVALGVEIQ